MLIGVCGAAGAGKGSVAAVLTSRGFTEIAFADPLYAAVSAITGISVERLHDRDVKETVIPWIGKSPRQMLQSIGTEWGREMVDEDIWVNAALAAAGRHEAVVIPDVRFDNEAEAIRQAGGVVLRVVRPGSCCLTAETAAHASEAGVREELIDAEIANDGSLDDLAGKVDAALHRLPSPIM